MDTSLLFSNFAEDDINHDQAKTIFTRILNGEYGQPIILDYVYKELLTLTFIRTKNFELCKDLTEFLTEYVDNNVFGFLHTPNEIFWKANHTFLNQDIESQKRFLSFTDAIIGEMDEWVKSSYIGTFDGQFHRFNSQIISE